MAIGVEQERFAGFAAEVAEVYSDADLAIYGRIDGTGSAAGAGTGKEVDYERIVVLLLNFSLLYCNIHRRF